MKNEIRSCSFTFTVAFSAFCFAQTASALMSDSTASQSIALPTAFSAGRYTPYGYIDNPYYSMVFNRSGVIRSVPPLGFGWWRDDFKGSYGGGTRDHVNYLSLLQMSVAVDGKVFVRSDDFAKKGVELYSAYHSKHMVSYDWKYESIQISLKYFLAQENLLGCFIEMTNSGDSLEEVALYATNIYRIGGTTWWGSDGLTARFHPDVDLSVSKVWAYGDVFALGSTLHSVAQYSTDSEAAWEDWIRREDKHSVENVSVKSRGPLWMTHRYALTISPKSASSFLICLARGKNEEWAVRELKSGLQGAIQDLRAQLADDQEFWLKCPILEGDWPEAWKHGWVYDFETIRMNVRQPIGIFKHPWDAMQVHSPRVVLGETSLDMMTLSYADPGLAKEVFYGTFADALMPNVPCAREDGSVNMISSDGSECGTAPMWGFPFHIIKTIYLSTGDDEWVGKLYPHLKAYIEWWLEHRTDNEGWLHCNNSWESGQDGSRRFLVAEKNEGAVADFVRTVDVEASMAEAMNNMEFFAGVTGRKEDVTYWHRLAGQRVDNTRAMFVDNWFRDFDARTRKPIILKDYYDVMMLTPLTCGVATPQQVNALKPMFEYFQKNPGYWLEWPPQTFTFTEAAWNADMRTVASEVIADIADRVYKRTDARMLYFEAEGDPFSYRIPGVANEFWPAREIPPGGENYGWGATLPMSILRNIVGFREAEKSPAREFLIAPTLPKILLQAGKEYTVRNLRYGDTKMNVRCRVKEKGEIGVTLQYQSDQPVELIVQNRDSGKKLARSKKMKSGTLSFQGSNGDLYVVMIE